ncbi:ABC-three component system middle component 6 [Niveispirillum sp.]|uniref:ABC-three component system middle component 6 n=1 Tax=Niveispirillum sp. TaxID=1917217 RepID=UPI001B64BA6F|nr:ABC-three component system middle component 6 [Niveispirillum sp.]MBP7338925.1 hypothetical protein [Niveispirillum sp.]
MILPAKHLKQDRALIGVGSEVLAALTGEKTVSELWEAVQRRRSHGVSPLSFDWFVLALSFLFAIDAVSFKNGILTKRGES